MYIQAFLQKKTVIPSETTHLALWQAVCCSLYFTKEEGKKSVSTYVFHITTHNLCTIKPSALPRRWAAEPDKEARVLKCTQSNNRAICLGTRIHLCEEGQPQTKWKRGGEAAEEGRQRGGVTWSNKRVCVNGGGKRRRECENNNPDSQLLQMNTLQNHSASWMDCNY